MAKVLPVSNLLSNNGLQGFFFEVNNFILVLGAQEIIAVKVRGLKSNPVLCSKYEVFRRPRTLTAGIF